MGLVELVWHGFKRMYWSSDSNNHSITSQRMRRYKVSKLGNDDTLRNHIFLLVDVSLWFGKEMLFKYGHACCRNLWFNCVDLVPGNLFLISTNKLHRYRTCFILLVDGTDHVLLLRFRICHLCDFQKILLRSKPTKTSWRSRRWRIWRSRTQ